MKEVQLHAKCQEEVIVDEAKLACNVGSGIVSVYATPMMIAAMEHAAVQCLQPFLRRRNQCWCLDAYDTRCCHTSRYEGSDKR